MPLIGIVTVLYNSGTVLEDFFSSLKAQTYQNFILYIVDNNSPDLSLSISKTLSEKTSFSCKFIENEDNYGIAKGNNIGIEQALKDQCEYILLSNNDIVLEHDTIWELQKRMSLMGASMAVPKIYYFDTNKFWAAGGYIQKWSGLVLHYGDKQEDTGQFDQERQVGYAATCFMLIQKEVFEKVGTMDEQYFVYWDDVDFVYRALSKGEKLWYIPTSRLYHKESTSTGTMSDFSVRFLARNTVYFALKHYHLLYALYVILLNVAYHCVVLVFKWPFDKWKLRIKAYREGFSMFLSSENSIKLF